MTSAKQGNREAFGTLYRELARAVHAVLIDRLGPDGADDAVQDVFIHAWERLAELREPAAFPGWILTIARRRAVDERRRAKPTEALPDSLASAVASDETARASEALRAIGALPEAYRETLLMRLVEGMSGPEIAAVTGLTHDSVRVNLSRGMRMLRESLGERR